MSEEAGAFVPEPPAALSVQVALFVKALRPKQWTKNGVVLAGLVFSGLASDRSAQLHALAALILFCLASGSCYLLNDLLDLEHDRRHPKKRRRPLASGRLSKVGAGVAAFALLLSSVAAAFLLPPLFAWTLVIYVLNTNLYSLWLKRVAILDVMMIATGFILRAVAGGAVIKVIISPWLLVCTAFLALFLGFGKRRHELARQVDAAESEQTRASLAGYTIPLLDQILTVVTACTVMSYSLYTFLSGRTQWLMLTIPFVLFGIFRYLALVHQGESGETPEQTLLDDRPLQVTIALWVLICAWILYGGSA